MERVRAHSAADWAQVCSSAFVPLRVRSAADRFTATLDQIDLAPGVSVTRVTSDASVVHRDPDIIAHEPRDDLLLSVHRGGRGRVVQHGREASLQVGGAAVYDASAPYALHFPGRMSELVLQVPRRAVPSTGHAFADLTARTLPPSAGLTTLTGLLVAAETTDDPARAAERELLAEAAVTLLHAALLPMGRPSGARIDTRALAHALRTYVDGHLADPDLGVDRLAAAHHVSARLVHKVFAEAGETPAVFIRERRLERARTFLGAGENVTGTALRCGFGDPDTFTRAFKRRYGHLPSALRGR